AIRATALLTVEGAQDDIAAPGQTAAAHGLCPALPVQERGRLVVPACGHFSLFHGDIWRAEVLPVVREFLLKRG
ncbi:MAG: polyhydroxyalkanoate depolymerase, partial [Paracoccaceae bacterium]